MAEDLVNALVELKENETLKIVKDRLAAGDEPLKILDDAKRAMKTTISFANIGGYLAGYGDDDNLPSFLGRMPFAPFWV